VAVYEAAQSAAKRFHAFDMAEIAAETGSVISAVMFGALAGSGALPFPRRSYEDTIRRAGVGVEASLRAFGRGYEEAQKGRSDAPPVPARSAKDAKRFPALQPVGHAAFDALVTRARSRVPAAAHPMVAAGLARLVDYQDVDYAREYLDLVEAFAEIESRTANPAGACPLTLAAAKHIARAMAYDDVIRVADLKTRGSRAERVKAEVSARPDQIVYTTEFMHPRMEEVCGTLPARIGLWIEARPRLFALLQRAVSRGQRVRTGTVRWFLMLYALAGLRRFRRGTLRHRCEIVHRDAWLERARAAARRDLALGVAILEAHRLVKGYSDTHASGETKFARVMTMAERLDGRTDAADWVRRLRDAALADAEGCALDDAIKTVESFLP
jgi:indolepyruvate ferredoxin oxidoreductase beta subunit